MLEFVVFRKCFVFNELFEFDFVQKLIKSM